GHDPDPKVVRKGKLRREGVELMVTFYDGAGGIETFDLIDASRLGYEATRFRYPGDAAPASMTIPPATRSSLLASVASMPLSERLVVQPPGKCAMVARREHVRHESTFVCAPRTAPILDAVAKLLGRAWP